MPDEVKQPLRDALALLNAGKNSASLAILSDLRHAHRKVGCVWLASAVAHDRLGREATAIPLYLKALNLELDDHERHNALICLGSSFRNVGRLADARRTLLKAIREDPYNPVPHLFLALVEHDSGDPTSALRRVALAYLAESQSDRIATYRAPLLRKFKSLRRIKPAAIVRKRNQSKP
jgi:Flp pilus assembly protein TadD